MNLPVSSPSRSPGPQETTTQPNHSTAPPLTPEWLLSKRQMEHVLLGRGRIKEPFILFTAMHINNIATMENWDITKGIKSGIPESLLLGIYAKQRGICDSHQDMPSGKTSIKQ